MHKDKTTRIKGEQPKYGILPASLTAVDCFHLAEIEALVVFADYFPGIELSVQIKMLLFAAIRKQSEWSLY